MAIDGNGTGSGRDLHESLHHYQYDADGNLLHLVNYAGGTTVDSSFDYTYNALGQTATMATLDGTWTYSYDADGELTNATFAPAVGSTIPSQSLTYVYNAAGDRTQTIINGVTTNYTSNSVNETTSTSDGTTYTYDADGNLVSETNASGTTTYTYDSLDRLTSVTSPTGSSIYQYDALGNLSATTYDGLLNGQVISQSTTQNLVDPTGLGNVVAQYDGSGNLIAGYTYGLGLVSQTTAGSNTNYYQFDGLGSTADLVSAAGSILNTYSYLPFGSLLNSTGSTPNPFTYVGQFGVSSDSSGLLNMNARDYDPTVGQFISQDPTGLLGGSLNLRQYALNQPTGFIDPTGTDAKPSSNAGDEAALGYLYQPSGEGAADVLFSFEGNKLSDEDAADAAAATAAEEEREAKSEQEIKDRTNQILDSDDNNITNPDEARELAIQQLADEEKAKEDAANAAKPPAPPGGSAGASGAAPRPAASTRMV